MDDPFISHKRPICFCTLEWELNNDSAVLGEMMEKLKGARVDIFWFLGLIALYFALQLWILPKLGIQT